VHLHTRAHVQATLGRVELVTFGELHPGDGDLKLGVTELGVDGQLVAQLAGGDLGSRGGRSASSKRAVPATSSITTRTTWRASPLETVHSIVPPTSTTPHPRPAAVNHGARELEVELDDRQVRPELLDGPVGVDEDVGQLAAGGVFILVHVDEGHRDG
jgi:hypothetical protein